MQNTKKGAVNHVVRYDHFGDTDVLYIAELPKPIPGVGEVLVKMRTAGINPGEASIRKGLLEKQFPSTFPSGQGSDLAGVVESVGGNVPKFKSGDEVIGFSNSRNAHAEYVIVPYGQLILRPSKVSWEQAGGLFVAGTTAYAAVQAVSLKKGETLIVSGAAGGVGSLIVQIAKSMGVNVIGIASESNHAWLKKHGTTPVTYGDDTEKNIKAALNGAIADAFIDTSGKGYVALAIKLGIPADRINTIIDFEAAAKYKVKANGSAAAATVEVMANLAGMIADGKLEIPIAKTYPLIKVKEAYQELEKHHTHGKIILTA